jgi:hypothetical protein
MEDSKKPPFYVDGLIGVVYNMCEPQPESEPIPDVAFYLTLFRRLHETRTMSEAVEVFKDFDLTVTQLDRLNSRLLDGIKSYISQLWVCKSTEIFQVPHVRRGTKLQLHVADVTSTAIAVVRTGNVILLDFAQQRGVDVSMLSQLHVFAMQSDSSEMLSHVWHLAPYDHYTTHEQLGQMALARRNLNSLRWMVERQLLKVEMLGKLCTETSFQATSPMDVSLLKYIMDVGGRISPTTTIPSSAPKAREEIIRYGISRNVWDLRSRDVRGYDCVFVRDLLNYGYPLRRFDLHYAVEKLHCNVIAAILISGLVKMTDECFQHHVLPMCCYDLLNVCFTNGYDGKSALRNGYLFKPDSMNDTMWNHIVRRIEAR